MYGACIYDAIVLVTNGRTNNDSRSRISERLQHYIRAYMPFGAMFHLQYDTAGYHNMIFIYMIIILINTIFFAMIMMKMMKMVIIIMIQV